MEINGCNTNLSYEDDIRHQEGFPKHPNQTKTSSSYSFPEGPEGIYIILLWTHRGQKDFSKYIWIQKFWKDKHIHCNRKCLVGIKYSKSTTQTEKPRLTGTIFVEESVSVSRPALLHNLTHSPVVFTLVLAKHSRCFRICRWVWVWVTE